MRIWLSFLICLLISRDLRAQDQISLCPVEISLLTCGPGQELYSSFGHTAIRVRNFQNGTDLVYNYGTFEFGPDFYLQFIRGRLNYRLSIEGFQDFISNYQYEGRSVSEQILNLDCTKKELLDQSLQKNALPENRYYRYQFLYDNCTTRAQDMILAQAGKTRLTGTVRGSTRSFRTLIHESLNQTGSHWSKLGIDLLLGLPVDKISGNDGACFRPDILMTTVDSTFNSQGHLARPTTILLPESLSQTNKSVFHPILIFSAFLLLMIFLTYRYPSSLLLNILDRLLFILTGLAAIILVLMWAATDHEVCAWNFNLLWALPWSLVLAFYARDQRRSRLFRYHSVYFLLVLLVWFFLPQKLNPALLPWVASLALRTYQIGKHGKTQAHKQRQGNLVS